MRVLVFGNPLLQEDTMALRVGKELAKKGINVKEIISLDELEEEKDWKETVLVDAVHGLKKVREIGIEDLKQEGICSLHDFDLGFYLKLKKKLGEIKSVKIIGLPMNGNPRELSKRVLKLV